MTYFNFMIELQKYYGIYENEQVKFDVIKYIKKTYYESELDELLWNIKKFYSIKYGKQPSVRDIIDTEDKYSVIIYGAGCVRIIPNCEKKKKIEDNSAFLTIKESKEYFKKMKDSINKNHKNKMKNIKSKESK